MVPFTQLLFSGLMSGAIYALLAIGLIITYRTSHVPNLAHGEAFAVAGLVTATAATSGLSLPLAMLAGFVAGSVVSLAVDAVILRPRSSWPVGSLMLATLGFAFLMRGVLLLAFGPDPMSFSGLTSAPPLRIAGGVLPMQGAVLIVTAVLCCLAVSVLLSRTPLGLRLRASAINADTARLMGIDVAWARRIAFLMAGVLASLAALLLVPLTSVDFHSGLGITLRAFIAAALAGMSERLALVTGLLLGLLEAVVAGYLGALFQDPVVFAGLIALALYQSRALSHGGAQRA